MNTYLAIIVVDAEWVLSGIRRILQIEEGVIHRGRELDTFKI